MKAIFGFQRGLPAPARSWRLYLYQWPCGQAKKESAMLDRRGRGGYALLIVFIPDGFVCDDDF